MLSYVTEFSVLGNIYFSIYFIYTRGLKNAIQRNRL